MWKKLFIFFQSDKLHEGNCIWLLEENEYKDKLTFYYDDLGIYRAIVDQSLNFSKAISRVGQNFTSTLAFYHENKNISFDVEIINDLISSKL